MSPGQQRCAVAAAVLGAHVLVVLLLLEVRYVFERPAASAPSELLVFLGGPASVPAGAKATPAEASGPPERTPGSIAPDAGAVTAPSSVGEPPVLLEPPPPPLEWYNSAHDVAQGIASSWGRSQTRLCDDSPKPGSWLPKCPKQGPNFEAEAPRAGFIDGLIPYLRLGKHCTLILGMVSCTEAPPADGHLFDLDAIRDPDRDRSSVPDIRLINEPVSAAPQRRSVVVSPDASRLTPR